MATISPKAEIAEDAQIEVEDLDISAGAVIEAGVEIRAARAQIGQGVRIARDSRFNVDELMIGAGRNSSVSAASIRAGS